MPNYAAGKIDINEGRTQILHLIWVYLLHLFGLTLLYTVQLGVGQFIGTLYTRRQLNYVSRLLLDDDEHQYTIYHTAALKLLPSIISHDLADMNVQLFYLLIGSMYYNGIIGKRNIHSWFFSSSIFFLRCSTQIDSIYSSTCSTKW